mmetsp:Transcript_75663/g.157705  ORF Transcript_75663/g.157705 Transcript_75663/m.157705 type:complete len:519 (-) Transcript_75663:44-1600(-)
MPFQVSHSGRALGCPRNAASASGRSVQHAPALRRLGDGVSPSWKGAANSQGSVVVETKRSVPAAQDCNGDVVGASFPVGELECDTQASLATVLRSALSAGNSAVFSAGERRRNSSVNFEDCCGQFSSLAPTFGSPPQPAEVAVKTENTTSPGSQPGVRQAVESPGWPVSPLLALAEQDGGWNGDSDDVLEQQRPRPVGHATFSKRRRECNRCNCHTTWARGLRKLNYMCDALRKEVQACLDKINRYITRKRGAKRKRHGRPRYRSLKTADLNLHRVQDEHDAATKPAADPLTSSPPAAPTEAPASQVHRSQSCSFGRRKPPPLPMTPESPGCEEDETTILMVSPRSLVHEFDHCTSAASSCLQTPPLEHSVASASSPPCDPPHKEDPRSHGEEVSQKTAEACSLRRLAIQVSGIEGESGVFLTASSEVEQNASASFLSMPSDEKVAVSDDANVPLGQTLSVVQARLLELASEREAPSTARLALVRERVALHFVELVVRYYLLQVSEHHRCVQSTLMEC